MPLKHKSFGVVIATLLLLFLWQAASMAIDKAFLPAPAASFSAFMQMCADGTMGPQFAKSTIRVVAATLLAVAAAVPAGLFCGRNPLAYRLAAPLVAILYPLPKVVFLPVLVVLFGLGNLPKILLIALIIFFQIFVVVQDAARELPQESVDAMRTLTNGRMQVFRHLLWPACLPAVLTALRVSVGTSVAVLFFAETFASFDGLGYLILDGMESRSYDAMFAGIIGMSFLGILLYEVLYLAELHFCRWQHLSRGPGDQ
jgi:ABC-type nitrate/sulfonate/bicarbonate transport system permease component